MGEIAGLYLHRLSIGMRLQADPTVIYGMGDRYDGDIRTVDLRTDGPYNTYTRAGLPPTPIALAGAAVIRATAHPEKTDAIYFVASPKGDGSHVFSATLRAAQRGGGGLSSRTSAARRRRSRAMSAGQGRFLTIEGIEGVGKTTQVARLSEALHCARHRSRGDARARRHAAGGENPRDRADMRARRPLPPTAELLLMFAARAVHLTNHVEPHLARRPLGDVRPLHRCDLCLSGRRPAA